MIDSPPGCQRQHGGSSGTTPPRPAGSPDPPSARTPPGPGDVRAAVWPDQQSSSVRPT
ncbi:hypothetical protein [Priestia megaterium]|uniref:hypothetical protein n=1 Tax=Priestia megaterium TaxID=1404 RepID=UPI0036722AA4